jgi:hypothetical protein
MSYTRWKRARYAVPAAVLGAVAVGAVVPTLSGASAPPDLPAQTAQQLVADMATAKAPQLTGAVSWTANLGLSDLSSLEAGAGQVGGGGNGFDPLTLLSGDYHFNVWLGAKAEHIALIETSDQEVDVVRNHNQAWIWDSSTQNVLHLIGPKRSSEGSGGPSIGDSRGLSAVPLTPMEMASRLLGHVTSTTSVTVGTPVYVAGQPAYQLSVAPKGAPNSTIRAIVIAIGANGPLHGVPLQVAVYANGQASPALELGFTGQLQTGPPPASELTFSPPPGSTVTTRTVGSGSTSSTSSTGSTSSPSPASSSGVAPLLPLIQPSSSGPSGSGQPTKIGTGWATVISGPAEQLFGSVTEGPLSAVTTVVTVHGQQGRLFSTELVNVLVMANGRYYAGFVTPSALEAAASANT